MFRLATTLSLLAIAFAPALAQQKAAVTSATSDTTTQGKPMRILVAYYSRTGTTRTVAQELAARLGADVEEVTDTKSRKGLWGWLGAGRDASKRYKTVIGPTKYDPADYDLVVLGTPVWAWNMTPAIRTYIEANREKFKKVAFFCTMGGNGDVKTFAGMSELCGQKPLATMALRAEEVKMNQYHSGVNKFLAGLGMNTTR